MKRLLCLYLLAFVLPVMTFAQLSGALSGTLGPGNFDVVGDVTISIMDTLRIRPGTVLTFRSAYDFEIHGVLYAVGTESDSIKFLRDMYQSAWHGLDFNLGLSSGSILEYCVVQGSQAAGLEILYSSPTIRHCTITGNYSSGC